MNNGGKFVLYGMTINSYFYPFSSLQMKYHSLYPLILHYLCEIRQLLLFKGKNMILIVITNIQSDIK